MTEDELKELEESALAGVNLDPKAEVEWLLQQKEDAIQSQQRVAASFRMWKFMRNDTKMKTAATGLDELRGLLEYIEKRLDELQNTTTQ